MGARDPVIVGVANTALVDGKMAAGITPLSMQAHAAKAALDKAALRVADVDGLLVAGAWGQPRPGNMMPIAIAEYFGIRPSFADGTRACLHSLGP